MQLSKFSINYNFNCIFMANYEFKYYITYITKNPFSDKPSSAAATTHINIAIPKNV